MHLLKISNHYLTMGGRVRSLSNGSCSSHNSTPTSPSTRSQHGSGLSRQYEDGQRFSRYRDLLRAQETRFDDPGYSNDAEALRAELYETKLKLLAAQLACENLALSVGPSNSCFSRLDSTYVLIHLF